MFDKCLMMNIMDLNMFKNPSMGELVELGLLKVLNPGSQPRRFVAPAVLEVLLRGGR